MSNSGGEPVPLRVLAIIDTVQVSGPGKQLAASVEALAAQGVLCRILVYRRRGRPVSPYEEFLRARGIDHVVVEEQGRLDLGAIARTREAVRAFAPDIVQTHGYKPGAIVFALRLARGRLRWVAFYHGATAENLKVRAYHALDQRIMRTADAVVVMSAAHHRAFGDRASRAHLIHNAVLRPAVPDAVAARAATSDGVPRLVVVGRLSHEKGVDVLLEACALLNTRGQPFALRIVGDGPDREILSERIRALGLERSVTFVGHVADPDPEYARADLLVIPSRSEGLPNVLLEAMRFDLPAVATRVGAIPEVLSDPSAGVLCEPGDAQGLVEAITGALRPGIAESGSAARQAIMRDFSLPARCERLRSLYTAVVGPRAQPNRGVRAALSSPVG